MDSRRVVPLAVAVLLGLAATSWGADMNQPSATVWATGDGMRVNPESGAYLEDRPDIHKDYPTGNYQRSNAAWDAAKGLVRLQAARNEFVAFQAVVAVDAPLRGIAVSLDALAGPGGAKIGGRNLALHKAWYVHVTKHSAGYQDTSLGPGWYPDALLPAEADGAVRLDIPEPRNHIGATQRNHTVWVDIFVPRDAGEAPPGTYTGDLVVAWPGGEKQLRVALDVWDFALPDAIHCRGDIWNGSLRRMDPETELRYYQMAHRHRFHPGVAGYAPDVRIDGTTVAIDWAAYDARLARYFDGQAFTAEQGYWGPGVGVPIPHIQLPFNCNKRGRKGGWPVAMEGDRLTAEGEAVWLEACRQFREHFDAHPVWRTVRKIVFLGGLDESYYQAAYDKMIYFSKLLRKGLGEGWFQYRIDGGYNSPAMRQLHPYVNLWVCHTAGWHQPKMLNFRGKGVETWFYGPLVYERRGNSGCGSNTFTDLDLLVNRGIGWCAWKHRSGYCQWEFDAHYIRAPKRVDRPTEPWDVRWTDPVNCRYGSGPSEYNGSGLLIYRGELAGRPGHPIPSIRLKAQRRGMQDYEYFWLLRKANQEKLADRLVDSIVLVPPFGAENYQNPNIWKHNPEAWDRVRIEAGEALHRLASQ